MVTKGYQKGVYERVTKGIGGEYYRACPSRALASGQQTYGDDQSCTPTRLNTIITS
jgi:hypothetical protein